MIKFFSWLLAGLLLFAACKKETSEQKEEQNVTGDSLTIQSENAPDWALKPPQEEGYLYAIGQATSSRPEIARRKAMLNARVKLAEKLSQQGDSLNTLLRWSKVKEEKQLKQGNRWQSFVLMEVPIKDEKDR